MVVNFTTEHGGVVLRVLLKIIYLGNKREKKEKKKVVHVQTCKLFRLYLMYREATLIFQYTQRWRISRFNNSFPDPSAEIITASSGKALFSPFVFPTHAYSNTHLFWICHISTKICTKNTHTHAQKKRRKNLVSLMKNKIGHAVPE